MHEMSCPEVVENHRILYRSSEIASILKLRACPQARMLSHLIDFVKSSGLSIQRYISFVFLIISVHCNFLIVV